MDPMTMAFIATTAYSAWNTYQAGQSEADAYRDSADAKKIQANRLLQRYQINEQYTKLEGRAFKGKQEAAFAASGIDIGSGTALSAYEDTANKIERKIELDRMQAQTEADSILLGAGLDIKQAGMASQGGIAGGIGQLGQMGFMLSK